MQLMEFIDHGDTRLQPTMYFEDSVWMNAGDSTSLEISNEKQLQFKESAIKRASGYQTQGK